MLEVDHLTRRFGKLVAVNDISFLCPRGAIMGFIGPNGSGKTTTMRVISGLLQPHGGECRLFGKNLFTHRDALLPLIGWMPDFLSAYDRTSVAEFLDFFAAAYFISDRKQRKRRVDAVLDLVDMDFKRDAEIEELSKGMKQRVSLARALIHDPEFLLLDEPAAGLDPRARIDLREVLRHLQSVGKTILVSSHILTELADFCDHVVIIEAGVLKFAGRTDDAVRRLRPHFQFQLTVRERRDEAAEFLLTLPGIEALAQQKQALVGRYAPGRDHAHEIVAALCARGFAVQEFREAHVGLEDIFLQATEGKLQ